MKKLLTILLSVAMLLSFAACGQNNADTNGADSASDAKAVKLGFIFLHDEN